MNAKEPLHKIVQAWATTISLILIPLAVAWIANSYQNEMSQQKLNSEYVSLAINILKEEPTPKNRELRLWAVNIIDYYSEVKLSSKVRDSLATDIKISERSFGSNMVSAAGRVSQKAKEFFGAPYGLGSETK